MNVELAALAVVVFLSAAVLVWDETRIWNLMRASEARFKGMQEEIKGLRRLRVELNEYPKAEAPKIDAHNASVKIGGGCVDVHLTPLNFVSTESHTRTRLLQLQRSRYSFSGMSIFLIISTIAAPLAYSFVFESAAPEMDIAILSTTPSVDTQPAIPASPQALPSMSERQDILASTQTGVEREVHAPSLQTTRRSESRPNDESDLTGPAPRDLESWSSESRMTEEKGSAMPDLRPEDGGVLHLHEDQESLPTTMNVATESTTMPVYTPAVTPAPLSRAAPAPTEAQGLGARTESESEQATRRPERRWKESDRTALQPAPDLESRTSESRMTAVAAKLLFEAPSPAAVAMPLQDPPFESLKPSIPRSAETLQRLARPREPTDRIILEEPAPQIVSDPLHAVPLPRASPKPRLRPAKPKLTGASVSTQVPAISVAKPSVAAAPVTTVPAVGQKPVVGSVNAQPPAASNWLRKFLDL